MTKTLGNTDVNGARKNVKDIVVFGDGDLFKLICKASSESEGWMKSTKAMEIKGTGCVIQVTTQQRNPDGTYAVAEALTFVPYARIEEDIDTNDKGEFITVGRKIVFDPSLTVMEVASTLSTTQNADGSRNCVCGRE